MHLPLDIDAAIRVRGTRPALLVLGLILFSESFLLRHGLSFPTSVATDTMLPAFVALSASIVVCLLTTQLLVPAIRTLNRLAGFLCRWWPLDYLRSPLARPAEAVGWDEAEQTAVRLNHAVLHRVLLARRRQVEDDIALRRICAFLVVSLVADACC